MPSILEINEDHIKSLDDVQLTRLLQKLLISEALQNQIPLSSITVSTELNAGDGGEDGRIKWEDGSSKTNWIPNRFTSFQVKATYMGPADCAKEILNSAGDDLKPKVPNPLIV